MSIASRMFKSFSGSSAQCTQSYDEYNKKAGVQWAAARKVTASGGQVFYSIFKTGDLTVDLKRREFAYSGLGLDMVVYKNPTYTGGTIEPVYNARPGLGVVSGVTLIANPTVTNLGEQESEVVSLVSSASQQGRGSPLNSFGMTRIFEPNTEYLLMFTSDGPQTISARIEWYEGNLDFDGYVQGE